ncbi:N-acetylmuramoyl-L-alanine amidase [Lysinibacter sp. HNR]|uniref:N-acetylmuramoyl-L-alanine amidase n=1 Tax=Lysinibacter sp. HNR TaxID=3031408 RepID=UPI002435E89E|nr:N-acetylmuramoyl-L-alanine amidase [Lysinibacter sp. HNR]WGD37695.1 N-acetylmuramoyl-L-alanine amidase [Lysinibacter sp. HNR]
MGISKIKKIVVGLVLVAACTVGTTQMSFFGNSGAQAVTPSEAQKKPLGEKPLPQPVAPKITSYWLSDIPMEKTPGLARARLGIAPTSHPEEVRTKTQKGLARFDAIGLSWTEASAEEIEVRVRVLENNGWTSWEELERDDDFTPSGEAAKPGTEPLLTNGAKGYQIALTTPGGFVPQDVKITLVDAGESPYDRTIGNSEVTAEGGKPRIITREEWGVDENICSDSVTGEPRRCDWPEEEMDSVRAMTIHHTAGTNDYTPEDAVRQVRALYAFQAVERDWEDIGYSFVADKFGRLYEGRKGSIDRPVIGAHALGFNQITMSVSVMGNYETEKPIPVLLNSLAAVSAWNLDKYGVVADPNKIVTLPSTIGPAKDVHIIHGHRDLADTLCPGEYLYKKMDEIRALAAQYQLSGE